MFSLRQRQRRSRSRRCRWPCWRRRSRSKASSIAFAARPLALARTGTLSHTQRHTHAAWERDAHTPVKTCSSCYCSAPVEAQLLLLTHFRRKLRQRRRPQLRFPSSPSAVGATAASRFWRCPRSISCWLCAAANGLRTSEWDNRDTRWARTRMRLASLNTRASCFRLFIFFFFLVFC